MIVDSMASQSRPISPDDYERLIHPLQAVADRVGRETEKFAEQLEKLNPVKQKDKAKRYEVALELVDAYGQVANTAAQRLQKRHARQQERLLNIHWQRKIKGGGTGQNERLSQTEIDETSDDPGDDDPNQPSSTNLADLWYWRQEQQTWALFRAMIEFSCPRPWVNKAAEVERQRSDLGHIHRYSSEDKIWTQLLIENDLARERYVVVKWLQDCAEISGNDLEIIVGQLESAAEGGHGLWAQGWLYTREAIKAQKRLRSWPQTLEPSSPGLAGSHLNADRTESLVTQLDPDAVTRERHVLEHQDQYFEQSMWLACWQMLRRGKGWSEIREWCRDRAEAWRAVSLRGAMPALDAIIDDAKALLEPNFSSSDASQDSRDGRMMTEIQGNRNRALWRRMCFALTQKGGLNEYERAVYGTLAGDLDSVERVCSSWDDFLYAHYNSLILGQFDEYLRQHYPDRLPAALARKFGLFDSVQHHGEPSTVGRRIVEQLKVHDVTCREAHESMKLIQGALIAKNFEEFVYRQGLALSRTANEEGSSKIIPKLEELSLSGPEPGYVSLDDMDGIRVLCHILFVFQDLGFDIGKGRRQIVVENVIVAYIDFLRLSGKISMVPLYASRLSEKRQLHTLGMVLLDISSPEMRRKLVRLMRAYEINVPNVIDAQMSFILKDTGMDVPVTSVTQLDVMEDTNSVIQMGRQVRRNFIGNELSKNEDMVIASFEWYLYADGPWLETFLVGSQLYMRFFCEFIAPVASSPFPSPSPSNLISTSLMLIPFHL